MIVAAIFAFLIIIICIFGGFGFLLYRRLVGSAREGQLATRLPFKWSYVLAPLILLVLTVITALIYYGKLPFQIPYHFDDTGVADAWILPQFALAIGVGIQVILAVISLPSSNSRAGMVSLSKAGQRHPSTSTSSMTG